MDEMNERRDTIICLLIEKNIWINRSNEVLLIGGPTG